MKEIIEIQFPFTEEHLDIGYGSKMLKCGEWYISVSKNRGKIPWIINMSKHIRKDILTPLENEIYLDTHQGVHHINAYAEEAVDFVNNMIGMNKSKTANTLMLKKDNTKLVVEGLDLEQISKYSADLIKEIKNVVKHILGRDVEAINIELGRDKNRISRIARKLIK